MRATVVFVTALLVVGAGVPLAAGAPVGDAPDASSAVTVQDEDAGNETDNETAPGARLAGVAAVQGAEVEGEVEQRSFGLQIAAANSNASKASVVASQVENLDERLADLRDRKAALEAAYENGSITKSRYNAQVAGLAARISTVEQLANQTADTARGLPSEVLAERGVNASAIDRLRTSARNLSGPEVAAIARDIAGPPNGSIGPPAGAGGGPPFGADGDDNRTAGPGNAPGQGDGGPGNAPGAENGTTAGPGDTPGQNATQGGPGAEVGQNGSVGDGTPGVNETVGNGSDAPVNGTDGVGNAGDTAGAGAGGAPGNGSGAPNGTQAATLNGASLPFAAFEWAAVDAAL